MAAFTKDENSNTTYKDAAAFSLLAYQDDTDKLEIPSGYQLLCKCPIGFQSQRYYGEAYYTFIYPDDRDGFRGNVPAGVKVVIAHRGTTFNENDLLNDFNIALKATPDAFYTGSKLFTDYVSDLAYSKFPREDNFFIHSFVHTGHSLGAIHAELSFRYQAYHEPNSFVFCISFENPGSYEMVERGARSGIFAPGATGDFGLGSGWGNPVIINTDVNLINSCNKQSAQVAMIDVGYDFINVPKFNLSPVDFNYFATLFTLDQHKMSKIYKYFVNGGDIPDPQIYPNGIKNAFDYYKIYKPYLNPGHTTFWDKALQLYWDTHQEIHKEYEDDENIYHSYMIKNHLTLDPQYPEMSVEYHPYGFFKNKASRKTEETLLTANQLQQKFQRT